MIALHKKIYLIFFLHICSLLPCSVIIYLLICVSYYLYYISIKESYINCCTGGGIVGCRDLEPTCWLQSNGRAFPVGVNWVGVLAISQSQPYLPRESSPQHLCFLCFLFLCKPEEGQNTGRNVVFCTCFK